jgi:hypothetical protein
MNLIPMPDDFDGVFRIAIEDLEQRARKIGLYYNGCTVGMDDPHAAERLNTQQATALELIREGSRMMVIASFNIGDMAFDPSVTDPDGTAMDREAEVLLPSDAEMTRDRIARALAEGKSIEDIFDDEG